MARKVRADHSGPHRQVFAKNKNKVLKTQSVCALCGRPVDKSLKFPDPLSPCIDHIIPVSKGGHPSDISNMQLAHLTCNRQKADKVKRDEYFQKNPENTIISNRILPQSMDWTQYRSGDDE